MDKFTNEERVKIIEFYFENRRSIIGTQKSFVRHFNVRHPPTKPTIINLVKRFQEHSSVVIGRDLDEPVQYVRLKM